MTGEQMYQKAQSALGQKHYFEPTNDSALYWAIQARKAGNPAGKALEEQIITVYKSRVTQYYKERNYPAAIALISEMLKFYPGNPSLLKDQKMIQAAQASAHAPKQ